MSSDLRMRMHGALHVRSAVLPRLRRGGCQMTRRNPQNPCRMVKVGNVTYQSRRSAAKETGITKGKICSARRRNAKEVGGMPAVWL